MNGTALRRRVAASIERMTGGRWSLPLRRREVMNLFASVLAATTLAGAAGLGGCGRPPAVPSAPAAGWNLLLVTLDTVRADHLGAYGAAAAETPNLDRLAGEGVRAAHAYAAVPLTLPSHATLLSGLAPLHHGLRNNGVGRFPAARPTLATDLAAAGYRTAAFVAAFVLDHRFGLDRGFALYDDEVPRDPAAPAGVEAERRGDQVVDRALAWLAKDDPRPFFAWVHLYDAHAPYAPPEPWAGRHAGSPYDGEIAFVDAQVGRLLAELDRRGLAGRTVVAVAADHGEALGEHGELTHGLLLYDATLAVPLLVRAPGLLPAGRVLASPLGLVDLAPTLGALLGHPLAAAPGAGGLDGRDLSAALAGGAEPPPADLYAETRYPAVFGWSGLAALRRGALQYIRAPAPELYDLAADPGEARNLAAGERRAAHELAARLARLEAGAVAPAAPPPLDAKAQEAPLDVKAQEAPLSRQAQEAPLDVKAREAPLDSEARARLASLGYAAPGAGSRGAESDAGRASPMDRIGLFRAYEEAKRALDSGHAAAARDALAPLVAADPGNPVFRGTLAHAVRELGDLDRAIALYRQAVEAAPEDSDGWYNLAVTLGEAGRGEEAAAVAGEAVARDPLRAETHNALGIALASLGRNEEARSELARAVELDPRDARAWNNLGNVLRPLGRGAEAEAAYRRSTDLAPGYPDPWNGLGTLAVAEQAPEKALGLFDRALALAPGFHEALLNRGIANDLLGDRRAAAIDYRRFLAEVGGDPRFDSQRRAALQLLARLSDQPS